MRMRCIASATTVALAMSTQLAMGQSVSTSRAGTKAQPKHDNAVMKVLHGTLEKLDSSAKTIAVKTADGGETVLHFTDATVVHGMEKGSRAIALAGKEGAHVVVHYTDAAAGAAAAGARAARGTERGLRKAGEKMAHAVVFVGTAAVNVAEGTVASVDRAAKTVAIDTAKGTFELYELGKECTINTGRGVERAATASGRALEKGTHAVLYYTEEGGRKVVRAIDRVAHGA